MFFPAISNTQTNLSILLVDGNDLLVVWTVLLIGVNDLKAGGTDMTYHFLQPVIPSFPATQVSFDLVFMNKLLFPSTNKRLY